MSDDPVRIATSSQTIGPFFHFGPGNHPDLGRMAAAGATGDPLRLTIRIADGTGEPVPDALVEIWHADARGGYPDAPPGTPRGVFHPVGRMPTDPQGACTFETIRPGPIAPDDAAHVNLCLFMRGVLRHLYTRAYFAGDPGLAHDRTLAHVPADRRETLMARPGATPAEWVFQIHLQGERETVFFDL